MLTYLLTALTLLITLTISVQSVSAAVIPTPPTPKKYYDLWQQMTLRSILQRQTVTPTPTPSKTPTPTVTPTKTPLTPIPTKTPTPTIKPTTTPVVSAPTNDVTSYIMNEINAYRTSLGLSRVQTNDETCNFAKIRAQEITTNFNHDGFTNRQKAHTLPYASWSAITENIAMTSNYKDVEKMWQNSPGHAANMRADTPYVCVMQSGNYFAYEGLKP